MRPLGGASMAESTPRVVHLVWIGSSIPPRVEQLCADLAQQAPDVDVRVWTDATLGWLRNASAFQAEPSLPGKADIARYEILHRHGGLYLDADFRVHRSLGPVFTSVDAHGLVVARQSRALYNNAFIAAQPGHPVLAAAVAGIPATCREFATMTPPARTGPHYLTSLLLDYVRTGGSFLELAQHTVYPWSSDEDPLPEEMIPSTVLVSHEWASARAGWTWGAIKGADRAVIANRRSRMRRSGGTIRARAAASPAAHRAIAVLEVLRDRALPGASAEGVSTSSLTATDAVLDGWTAREARRRLRGSAVFLDLHPTSWQPAMAAAESLDRPGRTIVIRDSRAPAPPTGWADRSIRCSVHDAVCAGSESDSVLRIESLGAALSARTVDRMSAPIGNVEHPTDLDIADLIASIPRFDLVRVQGDRLSEATAATLRALTLSRRIAELVVVVSPTSVGSSTAEATGLLAALEEGGMRVGLAPWLVDGRGRTWREHLRGATRPFLAVVRA